MIRMNTDQSMDDLFFTFKELVDQLTCIELKFLEELFVVLILNSLPRSFREYVQSIINMDALPAIKPLKCKLLAEEMHTELEDNNINTVVPTLKRLYSSVTARKMFVTLGRPSLRNVVICWFSL